MVMRKIYIIDNISSIVDFFSDFLSLKGYQIAVANDVEMFARNYSGFNPDLIIFDTDMPRSESYKFASLKASNLGLMHLPTILLTGFVNEAKINGFAYINNSEFLSKNSSNSQILKKIENIIERSHPESKAVYGFQNLGPAFSINH